MSWMAVPSVNTATATALLLLRVFFLSGASPACRERAHLSVSAPKQIVALSGSCLHIPCNFSAAPQDGFSAARPIDGVWLKGDKDFIRNPNNVVFNSSGAQNVYPMSFTGQLSQGDCTTLFSNLSSIHMDMYYFRVENDPFKATAVCDPLQITVEDSLPGPTIEVRGDLMEKMSVTITCSALTPCPRSPPELTWKHRPDPPTPSEEENGNGNLETKIRADVVLTDEDDGRNITCSARYPVNGGAGVHEAEKTVTLSVSYAPKNTLASMSPPGPVSPGAPVNLTCSSRANPPVTNFTWFKKSPDKTTRVSAGDFYSFRAAKGEAYFCVATNDLGKETSADVRPTSAAPRLRWEPVIWIVGILFLLCLIACVWRLRAKCAASPQSQKEEEVDAGKPAAQTGEENIHYGEIDFSRCRTEPSSDARQDGGQQPDTVYAQVKVTPAAGGLEDLYAQVTKKPADVTTNDKPE